MNVPLRKGMTLEEFLAWDETQEERWEFDGLQPVAMVGGTRAHSLITTNLILALGSRLRGTPCHVYNDSLRVLAAGSVRYPDAFVECGPADNRATIATNPVIVFEVLSPSTASVDQIVKSAEYRGTPSIMRYVMLAQDRIAANIFERRNADWIATSLIDPAATLPLPEIGISLPLAELYHGVIETE